MNTDSEKLILENQRAIMRALGYEARSTFVRDDMREQVRKTDERISVINATITDEQRAGVHYPGREPTAGEVI